MLFMMSGILCLSALPSTVCGIGTLPCSVLLKSPCSCSQRNIVGMAHYIKDCFGVLGILLMMLLMMHHQPHLQQPWEVE